MPDLTEFQAYVVTEETLTIGNYRVGITIAEESEISFSAQLKLKERNSGQEKVLKFRIGIEKHKPGKTKSVHEPDEPHFEIDYYQRENREGSRIYFTLNILDEEHLMKCIKGTLVILKEFLKQFSEKLKNPELINKLLYVKAINEELIPYKTDLINALYESYKDGQLVIKINGKGKIIKTQRQFKNFLNKDEIQPIYLPLIKKIENN